MFLHRGTPERTLDIPVMHDDQHGTAIISAAGLKNALEVAGKNIADVKIVVMVLVQLLSAVQTLRSTWCTGKEHHYARL